ncbi:FAD/NAD(P)-binding domain-containing protein [Bimuria novae-zelandiae CBS 107.79]|uniref:FAD/NAD(P)-binding domain-containing protein n=1 Tax=Bimuria novae-zelandiae CBS 107.79 TaxID=1447943 RepID=A0A6A5VFF1_9PLEO|nr:FAD/NAD(P)-binding domain-containing protein [Bimuria novae-zelandiae CBS 107.79]
MAEQKLNIAIIGGGIAGLSLALLLQQRSIRCTVYELRPWNVDSAGSLMLAPNALRILDDIGAYSKIRTRGYNFEAVEFKDDQDQTIDQFLMGSDEQYGYKALRIPRQAVLKELRALAQERMITVHYEKRFLQVLAETENGITFKFADGSISDADILIGADGIHSAVRAFFCPETKPIFSGQLAISAVVQRPHLRFPPGMDYHLPAIIHSRNGGMLMLPQSFDGSDVVVATQKAYSEQDRSGWASLAEDKHQLYDMIQSRKSEWSDVVQSALECVHPEKISIWPYYSLPKVPCWSSTGGRVVLLGDAAHAIPPTAGQGACQAFEDALSLAVLLAGLASPALLAEGIHLWEGMRKERIDKVAVLTMQLGNNRLPQAQREKLPKGQYWNSGEQPNLLWLYRANIEEELKVACKEVLEKE